MLCMALVYFRSCCIKDILFVNINTAEDIKWLLQVRPLLKTYYHIDKELYIYTSSVETSEGDTFHSLGPESLEDFALFEIKGNNFIANLSAMNNLSPG